MCDRIEIGIDGAQVWSMSKIDGGDACLCGKQEEEIYSWCLSWVQRNVPAPHIEERIVIARDPWGWQIYKEKLKEGEWEIVRFADEGENVPQSGLGKKLRAVREKLVSAEFLNAAGGSVMSRHTMDEWGKDHWSVLAYAECCAVDKSGILARPKMRCNESKRPLLHSGRVGCKWESKYSTRLKDGKTIEGHDDWDCLEELEGEGLLDIISLAVPRVSLTKAGFEVAAALRKHKAGGGTFNSFTWVD